MKDFIGRKAELKELSGYMESGHSEFIAIYGRRRVGKTCLIRTAAQDSFAFFVTGIYGASKPEQLTNFAIALQKYSGSGQLSVPKNWILAFYGLAKYMETLPEGRKIIFIDELPWMDTAKSGFIPALENFWNTWAVMRDDIKLIVCGSATSWMINNLIRNKGGLHNRLTHHMVLEPFMLNECEEFFKKNGFSYSRRQIAECYMIMGGIPYYLSMLDRSESLSQNIDRLFFSRNAPLKDEFNDLYKALFKNAEPHMEIVRCLASKGMGMTRNEIVKASGLSDNGALSTALEELENCGFIRLYEPFGRMKSTDSKRLGKYVLFQLTDFYTLFYYKFILGNHYHDEHFWSASFNSPLHRAWCGLSFEILCLIHLKQIKASLGISGVQTAACSWRSRDPENGAQIDLLIDRKDDTVNLCEMKYSGREFVIDKAYEANLQNKIDSFISETGTRKSIILTMVTTEGIRHNIHSGIVQKEIVLNDLFRALD